MTVITGQGKATYTSWPRGDSRPSGRGPRAQPAAALHPCSALVPTTYCYSTPNSPRRRSTILAAGQRSRPRRTPLSGDTGALVLTMIWGLALVVISAAGTVAAHRWSPWLAYLVAAPLALAVLWNLYQSLAALLPNVY